VPGGERFGSAWRLRRRSDFERCYRSGRRRAAGAFVLHWLANEVSGPRLGVTVSRRVGAAVVRHRLKRWSREVFRRWPGRAALPSYDLVVHFRPGAGGGDFGAFRSELELALGGVTRPERSR